MNSEAYLNLYYLYAIESATYGDKAAKAKSLKKQIYYKKQKELYDDKYEKIDKLFEILKKRVKEKYDTEEIYSEEDYIED